MMKRFMICLVIISLSLFILATYALASGRPGNVVPLGTSEVTFGNISYGGVWETLKYGAPFYIKVEIKNLSFTQTFSDTVNLSGNSESSNLK